MRFFKYLLRTLLISVVAVYFLAAIGLLVARYWALPQVDRWRPEIEALISREIGVQVKIGSIQAQWYGLNAALELRDISVADDFGVTRLAIPEVDAILSWRSVFQFSPVFRYVGVEGIALTVHRQADGSIRVAGFDVPGGQATMGYDDLLQTAAVRWLLKQGRLNLKDATLIWIDQVRGAPPVALRHLGMTLDNGLLSHRFNLQATLPPNVGSQIEFSARVDRYVAGITELIEIRDDGEVFLAMPEVRLANLAPWVDIAGLSGITGNYALRAWTSIRNGQFTGSTVDLAGAGASIDGQQLGELKWGARNFRLRLNGVLALLAGEGVISPLLKQPTARDRLALQFDASGAWFDKPVPGIEQFALDEIKVGLAVSTGGPQGLTVSFDNLEMANRDGVLAARGRWSQIASDTFGQLTLRGTVARFDLTALHRYLPDAIGPEVRQWVETAFVSGAVPQAAFEIAGPLDAFPFGQGQAPGVFRVEGSFQDWGVDYLSGWPTLVDMNGSFSLNRDRLGANVTAGALRVPDGRRLALDRMTADITNLGNAPRLTVDGVTRGAADLYLGLVQQTALRKLTPAFVKDLSVQGDWTMPLSLSVELQNTDDLQFTAALTPNLGSVRYLNSPGLTDIGGAAVFTDKGLYSRGLQGTFLGGKVTINGGFDDHHHELLVNGTLPWSDFAKHANSDLLAKTLTGQLSFSASVKHPHQSGISVQVMSNLRGTGIALPAPLGKPANRDLDAQLVWQSSGAPGVSDQWSFRLGNVMSMTARTNVKPSTTRPAYFDAVAIGIGTRPAGLAPGLRVDASLSTVLGEQWTDPLQTLMQSLVAAPAAQPLFPPLTQANLSAMTLSWAGTTLDNLTARLSVIGLDQFALAIKASQTEGDLRWRIASGIVDGPIVARFSRFAFGRAGGPQSGGADSVQAMTLPERGALSEIPALDLNVGDFTMYGAKLGALELIGRNSADRSRWHIERLRVTSPAAQFDASGFCRFDQEPGVSLSATLAIQDLGQLSSAMGQVDRVRKGQGEIKADVTWREFPWRFEYANLSGKASVDLKEGVFDHVSSRSARMLEILSLQSINRLFSLNVNPDETFSKGFPWNSIQGSFDINNGVVDTQDLAVSSPVATISFKGGSNLVDETWNLEAEVRPNLDLSGTAVATGFIVNPLVGLGALIGQYLLRKPVESALSARYRVTGPWDDPKIESPNNSRPSEPASPQSTTSF